MGAPAPRASWRPGRAAGPGRRGSPPGRGGRGVSSRPTRGYQRHFANLGYYVAINDYVDLLGSADWYAGRNLTVNAQARYRWLYRFLNGSIGYTRVDQLDRPGSSSRIIWRHLQNFDSRTRFNASVDYATQGTVLQQNSVDPFLAIASLGSQVNFDKRFNWGALNIGGSRSQDLSSGQVRQSFPGVSLTPSPVNITPAITWSPGFSFGNAQTFHSGPIRLLVPGTAGVPDTLHRPQAGEEPEKGGRQPSGKRGPFALLDKPAPCELVPDRELP